MGFSCLVPARRNVRRATIIHDRADDAVEVVGLERCLRLRSIIQGLLAALSDVPFDAVRPEMRLAEDLGLGPDRLALLAESLVRAFPSYPASPGRGWETVGDVLLAFEDRALPPYPVRVEAAGPSRKGLAIGIALSTPCWLLLMWVARLILR